MGRKNGTRENIRKRNLEIYKLYKEGFTLLELTERYNLCEDSIRKILNKFNSKTG